MPKYMVQSMSAGILASSQYYRKQRTPHVTHDESERFTADAKADYANEHGIEMTNVVEGTYRSGQGVPNNPNTIPI
ncbi:MAG: hypothetical protein L0H73_05860 [Nitrococcus sp.]|nr:hypothetical protein [Nitrococcus sp.]